MLIGRQSIKTQLLLLLLGMAVALPGRTSFQELRQLLRQEQNQQQEQEDEQQRHITKQFHVDLNLWARSLEQLGLEFVSVVEQCRPLGTRCSQQQVQRHLRSLRRSYSDLHAQLETLEMNYVGKISEEQLLTPTLRAVRQVLQEYERTLRLVNAEAYKLVNQ